MWLCVETKGEGEWHERGEASGYNAEEEQRRKSGFHGTAVVMQEHFNTGNKEWSEDRKEMASPHTAFNYKV